MEWRGNIVLSGRLLGVAIIVLGIVLAAWNATDLGEVPRGGAYPALRSFIRESLLYVWSGGLVLIVTEIVGATGGDNLDIGPRIDWTVSDITRAIAGVVLVAGMTVTVWDIREAAGFRVSEEGRYFLQLMLRQYLWEAGLLFLLAVLADHVSQGNALPEEEEGSLVATEL